MGEEDRENHPATGEDAGWNHLLSLLSDEDPSRRWKAAEGLARSGDPRALGPLVQLLKDRDWRVRRKAAWALGELGDPRAVIPLRRAMLNEMDSVKEMIEEAMQTIARKSHGGEAWVNPWENERGN
ncbi:MAG TPA: HEAT repeat domain-containing protein [Methanomicrobiales archaeon]|nr:HEAT repeat domain-containing protein [Methanomicrobiales archaeon]